MFSLLCSFCKSNPNPRTALRSCTECVSSPSQMPPPLLALAAGILGQPALIVLTTPSSSHPFFFVFTKPGDEALTLMKGDLTSSLPNSFLARSTWSHGDRQRLVMGACYGGRSCPPAEVLLGRQRTHRWGHTDILTLCSLWSAKLYANLSFFIKQIAA